MEEVWQFENPNFIRDREDLLDKIIRNKSVSQESEHDNNAVNFQILLNELDSIKMNQLAIGEDLRRVRKDNKTLWNENYMTRERHQQQAQTLDRILKFLAAVYGNNTGKILEVDNGPEYNDGQMTAYNPGPVSYTHLDVYKRQGLDCCGHDRNPPAETIRSNCIRCRVS